MDFRTATVTVALLAGLSAPALAAEADEVAAAVTGSWKTPNGSCDNAYFKSGERTRSVRGEQAMVAIITNSGTTVSGHMILQGAREGQLVNTMNDQMIFLFEPTADKKLHFIPLGPPVLDWQEVVLEKCP